MTVTPNHPGNKYISLVLAIPSGTVDYDLCKENSSLFPNYNNDWSDRQYFDRLVIKNLDYEISVKFHSVDYTALPIKVEDSPAIIEPFVYRDVFISNNSGSTANFNIILFSGQGIPAPPKKPTNLVAEAVNSTTIELNYDDNAISDEYYKIERSLTSAVSGFSEIDSIRVYGNRSQYGAKKRTYTDLTCSPSTQYWYRVCSYKENGGHSPFSNVVSVITPA